MNMMDMKLDEAQQIVLFWASHGRNLLAALVLLIIGIMAIQRGGPRLKLALESIKCHTGIVTVIMYGYYAVLVFVVAGIMLSILGVDDHTIRQIIMAAGLFGVALNLLMRPYIPTMPFYVGNIIKTGALMGKVEAITLINTRLRTFDGLTVFVPNTKILQDYMINYHVTPTRRVKLDVGIRYDQDIVKAKLIIESLLVEDPRVLASPRPVVYVMGLADSCVKLGGRGWVKNPKVWLTRCDLLEKIKYRFDQEGVQFAFPRLDVNMINDISDEPGDDEQKLTDDAIEFLSDQSPRA